MRTQDHSGADLTICAPELAEYRGPEHDRMAVTTAERGARDWRSCVRIRFEEGGYCGGRDQRLIDGHREQTLNSRMIDDVHRRDDRRDLTIISVMVLDEPHIVPQRGGFRAESGVLGTANNQDIRDAAGTERVCQAADKRRTVGTGREERFGPAHPA